MKRKILVVDDTMHVLEEVRDILEMEGFEVVTASDAREGMRKMGIELPDMVITDLKMPELTGFDFLRRIKSLRTHENIPVVILSANADKESIRKAIGLRASHYLKKPCSADELIDAVKTLI